jgi:nitrite reductase (NADH) large subunit
MARERLVVIGNGMAGLRFLERLDTYAPDRFDVTVVGAEPSPAYNRVLLSSLLAEEIDEAACRFRDRPWYLRQGVRLITGAPATAIDVAEREVVVGDLTTLPFDRLVIASGSTPIRLPKPGMDLPGVITFRDLADVAAIRAAARAGARAVVIGGVGIGFFIWDAWNSSRISDIIVALVYVGVVGFMLDRLIASVGHLLTRGTA